MRELMIEAEYAPFAPDWFLETASRWFTVQKTPCLQTAEAVIGEPTLEALQNAPQLRWLQMTWAGADRYLHGGFPRSVLLTTASGAFGETIAEHAIGMLLALCRRLPAYARQKSWNDLGSERRVAGGTALIFGAGDLGGCIARRLQAFGMKTFGVCRRISPGRPGFERLVRLNEAEALLRRRPLQVCTPHTVTAPEQLLGEGDPGGKEQEQPRRRTQGHDVPPFPAGNRSRSCSSTFRMPEEYRLGLKSVAAPIYEGDGPCRYAIGVICIAGTPAAEFASMRAAVMETAQNLSALLGHRAPGGI